MKKLLLFIIPLLLSFSLFAVEGSVTFSTLADWHSGFTARMEISNTGEENINRWVIEFDWDREITEIWNGEIFNVRENHYVIINAPWNGQIKPGDSLVLGFNGTEGALTGGPENIRLSSLSDFIARQDRQFQEYVARCQAELGAVSTGELFHFMFNRFESLEPYRRAFEYIETDVVEHFLPGDFEHVVFTTGDNLVLEGVFYKQKNPKGTIVAVPGWENVKEWTIDHLSFLVEEGYQVFFYNRRFWNFYKNPADYTADYRKNVSDVMDAVEYVKNRPDVESENLGVYGISFGGSLALTAAGLDDTIRFVISDGAPAWPGANYYFWESIKDEVIEVYQQKSEEPDYNAWEDFETTFNTLYQTAQISPRPLLILQGQNDTQSPPANGQAICDAATGPKELVTFPNSGHCDAVYGPDREEYIGTVLAFLEQYLP